MAAPARLTPRDLNRATLARQGLLEPYALPAGAAVAHAGSLQAQHPEWPPIALAARAATPATADLAGALTRRDVVRSSLMRITIHVVAADDLWPMFTVCQPMRLAQWSLLTRVDPHTSELGSRLAAARDGMVAALRDGPLTSLEIDRMLAAEIGLDARAHTRPGWREPETAVPIRVAWRHFAAHVPLVHVPHDGEGYGRSRYAVAEHWLGSRPDPMDIGAARRHVARRYLAAFGPATVDDLVHYVGRGRGGVTPWRAAVEELGEDAVILPGADGQSYHDLRDAPRPGPDAPAPPRLLARWDSLLLSHAAKRRARVIAERHRPLVYSRNADVLPTFLVDGTVAGTWELVRGDTAVRIRLRPFDRLGRGMERELAGEAERVLGIVARDIRDRDVELVR